jgi:hypothetical protein
VARDSRARTAQRGAAQRKGIGRAAGHHTEAKKADKGVETVGEGEPGGERRFRQGVLSGARPVVVPQSIGDQLISDVAFEIHHEAIVAQPAVFGGTRQQVRDVHPSRCKLLQDRNQTSWFVSPLKHDDASDVVPGRCWKTRFADNNESRLVTSMIGNVGRQNIQSV